MQTNRKINQQIQQRTRTTADLTTVIPRNSAPHVLANNSFEGLCELSGVALRAPVVDEFVQRCS